MRLRSALRWCWFMIGSLFSDLVRGDYPPQSLRREEPTKRKVVSAHPVGLPPWVTNAKIPPFREAFRH